MVSVAAIFAIQTVFYCRRHDCTPPVLGQWEVPGTNSRAHLSLPTLNPHLETHLPMCLKNQPIECD